MRRYNIVKRLIAFGCLVVIGLSNVMVCEAVPTQTKPQTQCLPMWYYAINGEATPEIHTIYYSTTQSMSGVQYIEKHGLNTYLKKENLDLEKFYADNPDFVAAGVIALDDVWNMLVAMDSVSPRILHSMNSDEEYYCMIRNECISLGTYNWSGNKLSVIEKAFIINNYICQKYEFDNGLATPSFQGMVKEKKGTSSAYTGYFDVMASISGINAGVVYGPYHCWNAVQFEDGLWYQVDVTWNDLYNNAYFMLRKYSDSTNSGNKQMMPYAQDWWITEDLY